MWPESTLSVVRQQSYSIHSFIQSVSQSFSHHVRPDFGSRIVVRPDENLSEVGEVVGAAEQGDPGSRAAEDVELEARQPRDTQHQRLRLLAVRQRRRLLATW